MSVFVSQQREEVKSSSSMDGPQCSSGCGDGWEMEQTSWAYLNGSQRPTRTSPE